MKHINRIYYIMLFVLSFLIIGGSSLLTADIGFNVLKNPTFYLIQLLTYLAVILVTLGTVFSVIDKFKEKDTEYNDTDKEISEFAKSKTNVPSVLSRFLENFNRKRKILQYKFNIKKKLHYLDSYRPWYWYILPWRWGKKRFSDEDIHIWNYGTDEEKMNNAYCKKRLYLEEMLSDEFIEKNIDKSYVKYKQVTESVILGGYYIDADKYGPNEFIETNLTGKIIRNKVPHLMLSFGFTFLMSSIMFDSIVFNSNALMNVGVKLIALLWNAYVAVRYGKDLCQTVVLKDIRFRRGIITEYEKWLIQEADAIKKNESSTQELIKKMHTEEDSADVRTTKHGDSDTPRIEVWSNNVSPTRVVDDKSQWVV